MHFPKTYFQKEVRCGFEVSSLMKRCWAAQLEVLEQFDRICKQKGLRYYAAYGTLLGAVRHKGFIPWDDDIDIWMYGEDLDYVLRELKTVFQNEGLELISPYSEVEYDNLVVRLINTRYFRLDEEFLMKYWLFPFMAGLDIFPLNSVPQKEEDLQLVQTLMGATNTLAGMWNNKVVPPEEKWELYKQITDILGVEMLEEDQVANQLWKLTDRISAMFNDEDSEMIATLPFMFQDRRKVFRKEWFGEPTYLEFEGVSIPCPSDYCNVLSAEFGEDYMTPKRCYEFHDYPYYKKRYMDLMEYFETNNIKCPDIYKEM